MNRGVLQLPILLNVEISEYEMYPGPNGEGGLRAEFPPGVSVAVGINGLGKTTLLNALFRLLSGPTDWKSRPVDKPAGTTPTEIGKWKTETYFQRRVTDGANRAVIAADVAFGERILSVRRRLFDLEILDLRLDGAGETATEDMYRAHVCALAGVKDFADFFLLLRYLVFFLEERQPVIWDKSAQFDLLRILFFDEAHASLSRQLYDTIQSKDSQYRNVRVQHNRAEARLRQAQAAAANAPSVAAEIRDLEVRIQAATDAVEELKGDFEGLSDEYTARRQQLEREKIDLVERMREYEHAESQYFAQAFPGINEVSNHVLVTLNGGGGCLICGNRETSAREGIRARLAEGRCPVCDSPQEMHEAVVPPKAIVDLRLDALDAALQELQQHTRVLTDEVDELAKRRHAAHRAWVDEERKERRLRDDYALLEDRLPPEATNITWLKELVAEGRRDLDRTQEEIRTFGREFTMVLEAGEARVREFGESIVQNFQEYAQYFLADACTLEYTLDRRRVGQEGQVFEFPSFTPSLASGVFEKLSQPRTAPHEVSESQREFIDLAFRMALIRVAVQNRAAMMVLETPEASLDVVFIARAGRLLSHFANQGAPPGNRVVASSNLNSTHMIPALFGALEERERAYLPELPSATLSRADRERRIINLLDIAVPNTAMDKYGDLYRQKLEDALSFTGAVEQEGER